MSAASHRLAASFSFLRGKSSRPKQRLFLSSHCDVFSYNVYGCNPLAILETHLPLPDQPVIAAVAADLAAVPDTQRMPRRDADIQTRFQHQAVTIQRAAIDTERGATGDEGLTRRIAHIAIGMFPTSRHARRQAHTVIQRIQVGQTQAEGAAEVVLGFAVDLQRGGTTLFLIAIAVVALVAEAGEGFGAETATAHGVAEFGEGLLAVGVVIAFRAIAETVEGDGAFAVPLMAAVRRAETYRDRAILMQRINAGVPALDVAVDTAGVEIGFRITAQYTQAPRRIQ